MKPKILAFAGSARQDSCNKKLIRFAASLVDAELAEITVIDLADYPLPLFDQDLEAAGGLPENAKKLKALMREHHALLISSPEYNSGITPLQKNVIDWCSRPESDDEPPLDCYNGKVVGLMAASPGGLGGMRVLRQVREIFGNINTIVIPDQVALGGAYGAFAENGSLTDEGSARRVQSLVDRLITVTTKLIA
ncbi:MAG: NAD(P)H-dependent oxidoreductase [Verrucomicrobiota bacterium]